MARGHDRRRPERDDEAEIDRMTDELVEQRRLEARRRRLLADEMIGHLMQSEQLEVIDDEGRGEYQDPAHQRQRDDRHSKIRVRDVPYDRGQRTPLPEQEEQ